MAKSPDDKSSGMQRVDESGRIHRLVVPGLHPLSATNVWLIREDDGVTMVDVGMGHALPVLLRALPLVEARLGRVRRVVLTHAHVDHAGALSRFVSETGAVALALGEEVPYLTGGASMANVPAHWLCRCVFQAARWLKLADPPPTRGVEGLREGDRVGGLEVLATPGHTPGSLSLWDPATRALITGDTLLFNGLWLLLGWSMYTQDIPRRNASARRYTEVPAQSLLAGHGPLYHGDVPAGVRRLLRP